MPGPGHQHSERMERCLKHVKEKTPAGRDPDEFAHRVCRTSVGKADMEYGHLEPEGECPYCRMMEEEGRFTYMDESIETPHDKHGYMAYSDKPCPDVPTLDDLLKVHILEKSDDGHIAGWASVEIKDRQGELVDIDAFTDDMLKWFVQETPLIHLAHLDVPVGKVTLIEKRGTSDGKRGLWVEGRIFDRFTIHKAVRDAIKEGRMTGFSIRGRAMEKGKMCEANLCYAYIPALELYGISIVERPSNPLSTIQDFSAKMNDIGPSVRQIARTLMTKEATGIQKQAPVEEAERNKPTETPTSETAPPPKPAAEMPKPQFDEARMKALEEKFEQLRAALEKLAPGTQQAAQEVAAMAENIEAAPPRAEMPGPMKQEEKEKPEPKPEVKKTAVSMPKSKAQPVTQGGPIIGGTSLVERVREVIQKAQIGEVANPWTELGFRHGWKGKQVAGVLPSRADEIELRSYKNRGK